MNLARTKRNWVGVGRCHLFLHFPPSSLCSDRGGRAPQRCVRPPHRQRPGVAAADAPRPNNCPTRYLSLALTGCRDDCLGLGPKHSDLNLIVNEVNSIVFFLI